MTDEYGFLVRCHAMLPDLWACHLCDAEGAVVLSGFGPSREDSLAAAHDAYRRQVARRERELAATRRSGWFACPECFSLHPEDRGSCTQQCYDGLCDTLPCPVCDADIAPGDAACQCGNPDSALCRTCAAPEHHRPECPARATEAVCRGGAGDA